MSNTANLQLPLLAQAQAQKHVAVNEALSILDGLAQLTLESVSTVTPPGGATEGQAYLVPWGATGVWATRVGDVAVFSNGGWLYVRSRAGWRAFVKDEGRQYLCDGAVWHPDALAVSWYGAGLAAQVIEQDHNITNGAVNTTAIVIPAFSTVVGVTGRVVQAITGSLSAWHLGVNGSRARYGAGLGTAEGSWAYGMSGAPLTYYRDTPLVLSAASGAFVAGRVRLSVQVLRLGVPRV